MIVVQASHHYVTWVHIGLGRSKRTHPMLCLAEESGDSWYVSLSSSDWKRVAGTSDANPKYFTAPDWSWRAMPHTIYNKPFPLGEEVWAVFAQEGQFWRTWHHIMFTPAQIMRAVH